jgi:hypothetical protein
LSLYNDGLETRLKTSRNFANKVFKIQHFTQIAPLARRLQLT